MKKSLLTLLICLLAVFALCACGQKKSDAEPTPTEEPKQQVKLTFMNGSEVLGTLMVDARVAVTGYEKFQNIDGYVFEGWYRTPTLLASSHCDLATETFFMDTKLFGSFRSTQVAEDTRKWYIVGEGSSKALRVSKWAGSTVDDADRALCELKATGKATNEFAITLDLYAGDMFQLIYDWQWDGQKGYGVFEKPDATMFESSGSLSGDSDKANVKVIMDGNYTITLTTDPANALYDVIKIVRNGDAAPAEVVEETPYEVNEKTQVVMKGSWVADWSENITLTRTEGTDTYVISKELEAGTELYFMLWDDGSDTGIGMNATAVKDDASKALLEEAYNVKVKEAGTYTFTVDAKTLTITVTK